MILKKNKLKLGFLQGRLTKQKKKIQQFPKKNWKSEFKLAKSLNLNLMEWTIDHYGFFQNPLMNIKHHRVIKKICKKYKIKINSITADFFMEKPFWKQKNQSYYLKKIEELIEKCGSLKVKYIVLPLVDNSSVEDTATKNKVVRELLKLEGKLIKNNVICLFESDYAPKKLLNFLKCFQSKSYGLNYDLGNSASLGYNIDEEFKYCGKYIRNVHLKDRLKNGPSVRFGLGNANFKKLFNNLKKIKYLGALILQSSRSKKKSEDLKELEINIGYLNNLIGK